MKIVGFVLAAKIGLMLHIKECGLKEEGNHQMWTQMDLCVLIAGHQILTVTINAAIVTKIHTLCRPRTQN